MNLYFWHMETDRGVSARCEEFLGRADSPRVKRELLRRMAAYDRRIEQRLAGKVSQLEHAIGRLEPPSEPVVMVVEHRREGRSRNSLPALFAGIRGI